MVAAGLGRVGIGFDGRLGTVYVRAVQHQASQRRAVGIFQNQSSRLSGGKIVSVFIMGILSALIVGPCVAPPLAFALGYIGQTGDDAVLDGLALYTLALGIERSADCHRHVRQTYPA